jgi:ATP-dependent helicase/nuclease subunit B
MLFIDGFFDFTPIQKKLLRYLIERIPEVTVTLTFDPANPSVFHTPLQDTLAFFSSLSEPLEVEQMMETEAFHPALVALRRGLFNPDAVPSRDVPPIRVFSGANFSHEVEEIAREVKRLVGEEGYRPREIAVIARTPAYLQAVGEELDQRGIPSTLGLVEPLLSIPSVKAALKVLDCRANHALTEPYVALLKNDYLHPFTELERDAVENAMVAVGIELPLHPFRQRLRSVERITHYQAQTLTSRLVDLEELTVELARLKRRQTALAAAQRQEEER